MPCLALPCIGLTLHLMIIGFLSYLEKRTGHDPLGLDYDPNAEVPEPDYSWYDWWDKRQEELREASYAEFDEARDNWNDHLDREHEEK
ncbi:MAG: hypothetical protein UV00_C0003G0103 [candidate division WWE3 bacterium GW2011_GWF1_42_14]|uniref:Uncharacterized protein n=1 Tax=candidate division WWE3 bacterium GW2011_GWF1_42_14 TaxID=1619138 RepID=A0A0G1AYW1_UNCKA|nr:MAG: hypothetical protein UU92_C0005G0103 [candidate division WWE3 bacterium GW2011_GWA1_42_12]KKS34157.1 MAG: hypothetical protein UU97_C0014G0008 [candidate division WWE3 bacterium GW2011_GWD1_42_14]KKS39271.1 MAG: hypothetical protein UV00_C0003G0103 [candidate division WWE3 bacterium GW2011_GWF1_42_14]KKS40769.1 MAG: hypothetical protein UV03_C0003G0082 [candidate division WWE3 bacterium GW2011_GWE1_42_16]